MPTSNFLIFDQNKSNMIGDEAYQTSTQRLNGVQSGVASSMLNNKFAYQVSLVAYAIAQIMNQNGIDATDTMAVSQFVNNLSSTFLQKVVDKASVSDAVAASSDSKWMSPKTVKSMLQHIGSGWQLLQKWETAGTYTWTAPDLLGNGQPYEIGILLIGGGGSGGVYNRGTSTGYSPGGGSGQLFYMIFKVNPLTSHSISVGAGGQGIFGGTSGNKWFGNNGVKTTFDTYEAGPGYAEGSSSASYPLMGGGQMSTRFSDKFPYCAIGGIIEQHEYLTVYGPLSSALQTNPFENDKIILVAGGTTSTEGNVGQIKPPGFPGASSSTYDSNAVKPTIPGAGGGSVRESNSSSGSTAHRSADGADGACYIYVSVFLK